MQDKPGAHAGGWKALTSGLQALRREESVLSGSKALLRMNQHDGFDCPGCAWPEPHEPSKFEFCENGIKAIAAEATSRRASPEFFAKNPVSRLRQESDRQLESHGRLTHPLAYNSESDCFEPIQWEEAFALIGEKLQNIAAVDPSRLIFYTSGRTSNEAAFLYQLLGRRLGTNNFPDCSNMCHESSGTAMSESLGIGKGTVTIEDFDKADVIFVFGQNPGTNHPRMLSELQKASQRGARIVVVNPLRERGLCAFLHPQHAGAMLANQATPIASHYLQPLVGGDMAVLKGMMKHLLAMAATAPGVLDRGFIDQHTVGFESLCEHLQQQEWSVIEAESGLSRADIEEIAEVYAKADAAIVCWAMGLTQHRHAVATIQDAINLLLLRGNVGRPGAGACPVRGHSNVQGDRTVGITERPKPDFLDRLGSHFGFTPPTEHGFDVVAAIEAMHAGEADAFVGMGGNFLKAAPDTPYVADGLRACDLKVHVATRLNHTHLVTGGTVILLPCLGRSEQDLDRDGRPREVTVEDSMSMVHLSRGRNRPASTMLRSEPDIVAGIAAAIDSGMGIDWQDLVTDYDKIRDAIEKVIPLFADFNKRVRRPGGFQLRNSARERDWNTTAGKAVFCIGELPRLALPDNQLRLMTLRSHDQYNTTVYSDNDRYRGIYGTRRVVLLNSDDLAKLNLVDGDLIDVETAIGDRARKVTGFRAVAYDVPAGCAAAYFPEVNPLVPIEHFADKSRTPASKFIPVIISPHRE